MFRKHTRRAARAAYAISFGVALLIGLTACGGGGSSGGPITSTSFEGLSSFDPFGIMASDPPMPTGTIGTCVFAAT